MNEERNEEIKQQVCMTCSTIFFFHLKNCAARCRKEDNRTCLKRQANESESKIKMKSLLFIVKVRQSLHFYFGGSRLGGHAAVCVCAVCIVSADVIKPIL